MRDRIRNQLQRQGFFLDGLVESGLSYSAAQVETSVNTHERDYNREGVLTHASDNNYNGMGNLFLTRLHGDSPAPAGTNPWFINE